MTHWYGFSTMWKRRESASETYWSRARFSGWKTKCACPGTTRDCMMLDLADHRICMIFLGAFRNINTMDLSVRTHLEWGLIFYLMNSRKKLCSFCPTPNNFPASTKMSNTFVSRSFWYYLKFMNALKFYYVPIGILLGMRKRHLSQ